MRSLGLHKSPLIGMIHLPALPGAPRHRDSMKRIAARATRDAAALTEAGVDALIVENFGDVPFPSAAASPETVAAMATVTHQVVAATPVPVGVNVLRNDGVAALAVAVATGASFIRVNVLSWARLTDQGIIEGRADELLRRRAALGAESVLVLADVAVKHSAPLAALSIAEEAQDAAARGLADAVVVTGEGTGRAADLTQVDVVSRAVDVPVLVGSGVTPESAARIREATSGAIVGSAMMKAGQAGNPVSLPRARRLVAAWRGRD